jgi:hypothetical protein
MAESVRLQTAVPGFIPVQSYAENVALFCNPGSGDTRCTRILGHAKMHVKMQMRRLFRQVCVIYHRGPHGKKAIFHSAHMQLLRLLLTEADVL